jgi:hypothetical protein
MWYSDCSYRSGTNKLPSRARLCYWSNTLTKCLVRVVLQADYVKYAPDKAFFSKASHPVIYPTCFLWVPGIDAAAECSSASRFTGYVVRIIEM